MSSASVPRPVECNSRGRTDEAIAFVADLSLRHDLAMADAIVYVTAKDQDAEVFTMRISSIYPERCISMLNRDQDSSWFVNQIRQLIRNKHRIIQVAIICAALATSMDAYAESQRDRNARALEPYLGTRTISTLEWELLQFNLLWEGAFVGSVNYVTSYPVMFDPKAMRFRATFRIQEKREYNDPEPFFKLPRAKRESVLQGAVDQLVEFLAQSFPEIKSNSNLVYAEFLFRTPGSGRSIVAKYENGSLSLAE
jgi:hypothetical protein